jgi:hypothetical protein
MTLLGAAAATWSPGPRPSAGRYGMREVAGGERLELLGGRMDLPALAETLARDGRPSVPGPPGREPGCCPGHS